MVLTGIKDVDRLIISFLPDKDILTVCQTNKYIYNICNENFFRNLVYNRYQNTIKYKDYVKTRTWRQHFISIVYYIDKLEEEFNYKDVKKDTSPELEYFSRELFRDFKENNGLYRYMEYDENKALTWASYRGSLPVVKYLVEKGADIHFINDYALRYASLNGHLPVVKYLVENKADIHVYDNQPLRWAKEGRHAEVVGYLESLQ